MSAVPGRELIKICGVTRPGDARLAAELGADLIGLNFYPPSPRALDPEKNPGLIEELVAAARQTPLVPGSNRPATDPRSNRLSSTPAARTPLIVGVFVDEDPARIEEIAARFALDLVQLHGDEPPEVAARFGARAIQVFRRGSLPDPAELAEYEGAWGLLFDVPAEEAGAGRGSGASKAPYGGTGRTWRYEMLAPLQFDRPALVAGGIRPGNARRALERSRAGGVDVCSGVESAPGVKDPERMRRLFEEVRHGTP